MAAVVIPAAGSGTRIGGQPKQFRQLGQAPLLFQTVRVFEQHPEVNEIVVVGDNQSIDLITDILSPLKKLSHVVVGGATRQESVYEGLLALNVSTSVVLVHDAARPFITGSMISSVIESTIKHGAAAVAVPVTDTVRYGENGRFTHVISRDGLYLMQTPQGFNYSLLVKAFKNADLSVATDDVAVMEQLGYSVHIIHGDPRNIKITTQSDWNWAQKSWEYMEFGY
ncbi:MAG: 2-C-methyl-D-erythritol 4-phosphate cytidylyltransferase [Bacteroidetes bacterium]|nr:2-C-methyl-D-erythritol 4-phosphate cytidylyltransferase [Bacteroidota bacterium]